MFVLVHTVTMTCVDYEIRTQFYHALRRGATTTPSAALVAGIGFTLVGKRVAVHYKKSAGLACSMKWRRRRPCAVRHALRTFNLSRNNFLPTGGSGAAAVFKGEESGTATNLGVVAIANHVDVGKGQQVGDGVHLHHHHQLSCSSSADDTIAWLTQNRFGGYLSTFESFSGADILRLTRDDLIQICGLADGIRLYNTLHSKSIPPKLTLYICMEQSNVFNALYLSTYTVREFAAKLASVLQMGSAEHQVQGYFVQGPNGIHIHVDDDVVRNLKNETMYTVLVIAGLGGACRVLLKPLTHLT